MAVKKATTETKQIEIPPLEFRWMMLTLRGESPLILNRCSESTINAIETKQTGGATNKKAPRDPEQEYIEHCYPICDGAPATPTKETFAGCEFGFPAIGIKKAICTAGMRFADAKKVQMFGVIFVHGPHRGLIKINGVPVMGRDPVKPPAQNTMHIAYRPYFDPWEMVVPIRYVSTVVTAEQLINAVRWAGISIGLGSWRVENGGDKGVFEIGKIQEFHTREGFDEAMARGEGLPIDGRRRLDHRATSRSNGKPVRAR